MSLRTVIALVLALASTTLTNIAYLREHDAAAALPVLSMRRPFQSLRLLLSDRSWLLGFAMESSGFLLYAAALSLASLALVQTIGAGGIRVLFVLSLVVGYTAGTFLLQLGYQTGGALTVAGLATLLTNALPIAAGTVVLEEPVPPGAFGGLRILAFAAVTAGAFLLARPDDPTTKARRDARV